MRKICISLSSIAREFSASKCAVGLHILGRIRMDLGDMFACMSGVSAKYVDRRVWSEVTLVML